MLKLSDELLESHELFYKNVAKKVKSTSYKNTLEKIKQEVLEDGVNNWGRIAAIFTLCFNCVENEGSESTAEQEKLNKMFEKKNRTNYICLHCGNRFKTKAVLIAHKQKEHNDFKHRCKLCPYACGDTVKLERHVTYTHKGEKRCRFCQRLCSGEFRLAQHEAA